MHNTKPQAECGLPAPPSFSVIMPTYNRAGTVEKALVSILRQTCPDFEVIVVDDGSEDDTEAVVRGLNSDRIVYLRADHSGVCPARNRGIQAARGKYITFLDSDDEAENTWLDSFHEIFLANSCAGLVFCGVSVLDSNASEAIIEYPADLGPIFQHKTGFLLPGSFAVRADVLRANGGYDEGLAYSENTELILRLIGYCVKNNLEITSLNSPLIVYHREKNHSGKNYYEKRSAAIVRIIEKHRPLFEADKRLLAIYYSIAGVDFARLKKNSMARFFLLNALRVQPTKTKHLARFLMMLMPPLARFMWRRNQE
jgi:glycosyltransferase involved in cell wall biosynthesis